MVTNPGPWWVWLLPIVFGAPWIAGIIWFWVHDPRDGATPPSTAEQARQRLWMR